MGQGEGENSPGLSPMPEAWMEENLSWDPSERRKMDCWQKKTKSGRIEKG